MKTIEKQVLTIIDGANRDTFLEYASHILKTPSQDIQHIVEQLQKDKHIEISKELNIFFHTSLVRRDMLDETLHYKYGLKPLHTYE